MAEQTMSRCYDDPVEVRRGDEEPAQFLWRGRLYLVREVLAHWVEAGSWWRTPQARAALAADPAASSALPTGPPEDGERELWRVEAAAGRSASTGVYDLCFDWTAGAWSLVRTLD